MYVYIYIYIWGCAILGVTKRGDKWTCGNRGLKRPSDTSWAVGAADLARLGPLAYLVARILSALIKGLESFGLEISFWWPPHRAATGGFYVLIGPPPEVSMFCHVSSYYWGKIDFFG